MPWPIVFVEVSVFFAPLQKSFVLVHRGYLEFFFGQSLRLELLVLVLLLMLFALLASYKMK